MIFREINKADWPAIKSIYESGISTGIATFQLSPPSWEEWNDSHLDFCRIIAKKDNIIIAWAALSPISKRNVYRGVAEVSLYVHENFRGLGLGESLLKELITQSENAGIWTLQSSIFPQNIPSIRMHKNAGFRIVGNREKIGRRNGIWYDNLLLERRTKLF